MSRADKYILTLKDCGPISPTLEDILAAVVEVTRVPVKELYARHRYAPYCRARHIYCYVATVLTGEKCEAVSGLLNRHRSTSHHGYQTVKTNPNEFEPELSRVLGRFQRLEAAA